MQTLIHVLILLAISAALPQVHPATADNSCLNIFHPGGVQAKDVYSPEMPFPHSLKASMDKSGQKMLEGLFRVAGSRGYVTDEDVSTVESGVLKSYMKFLHGERNPDVFIRTENFDAHLVVRFFEDELEIEIRRIKVLRNRKALNSVFSRFIFGLIRGIHKAARYSRPFGQINILAWNVVSGKLPKILSEFGFTNSHPFWYLTVPLRLQEKEPLP